jgi:adenylosuccinate lyase
MIARYTRPELAAIWSDEHRYETWLRVELAACEAMETQAACRDAGADTLLVRGDVANDADCRIAALDADRRRGRLPPHVEAAASPRAGCTSA